MPGRRHPSSYLSARVSTSMSMGPLGAWLLLHLALLSRAATPSDGGKKPKARRKADVVKASAKKPTKKAVPAKVARVRIINATSRGRVGKLTGATRIKRIEWSPSRKITHKMLTAANPPPTAHGAALCISGELRSFAMPLVHNTIKRAADAWRADTFMVYHTDYDARAMTHPHRMGAQSCIYNESTLHYALHVLNPVATSRFNRKGVCSSERRGEFAKASIQFAQIAQCFELARRHEAKHDDVRLSLLANTSRPYHCIYSFNHTRLEPLLLKALHSLPAPTRSDLRPQPAPVREAPRISKLKDIMSHLTAEEAEMWRRERMSFEAPAEHEVEEHEPQGRHLSVAAGVGSVCGAGWICWLVRWWSRSREPEI